MKDLDGYEVSEIDLRVKCFGLLCDEDPPAELVEAAQQGNHLELQEWCALHLRLGWMTGISVLDTVDLIIAGALENGNLTRGAT